MGDANTPGRTIWEDFGGGGSVRVVHIPGLVGYRFEITDGNRQAPGPMCGEGCPGEIQAPFDFTTDDESVLKLHVALGDALALDGHGPALTLNEYQRLAMRTSGTPREPLPLFNAKWHADLRLNAELLNATLGICGEGGELADDVKKALFHGKEFDEEHAKKELGDVLWYVAQAADALGVSLEGVARMNVEKLKKRYPEGFSAAASAARADGEAMPEKDDVESRPRGARGDRASGMDPDLEDDGVTSRDRHHG